MKKKLLTVMMAAVLCTTAFAAGCGKSEEEKVIEESVDETLDSIEESVNEGVDDLEIPESTGNIDAAAGSWVVDYLVTAEGDTYSLDEYAELNGVSPDSIYVVYGLEADGTGSILLAGVESKGVWSIDEADTISFTTPSGTMTMEYVASEDYIYLEDANTGITTFLVRAE